MPERVIAEDEYYDRAYGAWLGKNIGGTLGEPVEGRTERLDLDFYPELPDEGGPLANDDLDLQLVWLHALEQYGPRLTGTELGREWVDHVFFPYNEYRYGLANVRRGIDPPVAGSFNNDFYSDCMGSPIRSEVWALVAPGAPGVAAQYAYEDAIVDHAGGEGVYGEMFNAALESAAFFVEDPRDLIEIGLAHVPEDCRVASAVRDVVEWHDAGHDWETTRELVLDRYGHPDMTNAPQNFGFVVLGWLYGEDFGDALLTCVNCGYDTDSSGATLGSILGIRRGREGVPERWADPVGDGVVTRAEVRGFRVPDDLDDLTRRTLAAARTVIASHDLPVAIAAGGDTRSPPDPVAAFTDWTGDADPRPLWDADPTVETHFLPDGSRRDPTLVVEVGFGPDGPAIGRGRERTLDVEVRNASAEAWTGTVGLSAPAGWAVPDGLSVDLAPGESRAWEPTVGADDDLRTVYDLAVELHRDHDGSPWGTERARFSLVPARHWRVSGPGIEEREVVVPADRLDLASAIEDAPAGAYRARTTMVTPRDRTMQLEVHTSAAATATVDGDVILEKPATDGPDMLEGTRWYEGPVLDLAAGEHEVELAFEADDALPGAYVVPAATGDTAAPGSYYYLTDVLFA